ncbi:hypothetical protein [Flexibacter flexilis]|uniref:hypothetical protein n=1 Tax=Flexibacter flexilis TaxID=998 RepID=UPI0011606FAB|nr:hypothetical protein [Flexibacter flexilis]
MVNLTLIDFYQANYANLMLLRLDNKFKVSAPQLSAILSVLYFLDTPQSMELADYVRTSAKTKLTNATDMASVAFTQAITI